MLIIWLFEYSELCRPALGFEHRSSRVVSA